MDVFPFDNVSDNPISRKIQYYKVYFLKRLLLAKLLYRPNGKFQNSVYKLVAILFRWFDVKNIVKILDHEMRRYNSKDTSNRIAFYSTYGYIKDLMPSAWANELKDFDFEDIKIKGFKQSHEYLSKLYGEYMSPPPSDKRYNRHGIIEVKL
ncbi:LicD family protein [Candidatus Saccharibacteria bacterium]|nr:MAG: LicD family protein [Candidatus Saccharibacteria bacterium]